MHEVATKTMNHFIKFVLMSLVCSALGAASEFENMGAATEPDMLAHNLAIQDASTIDSTLADAAKLPGIGYVQNRYLGYCAQKMYYSTNCPPSLLKLPKHYFPQIMSSCYPRALQEKLLLRTTYTV